MNDDRTVARVDDADLEQVGGGTGADEHREPVIDVFDEDRVVEGMDHVVVADAVFACTGGNEWRIPDYKLACASFDRKLSCKATRYQRTYSRPSPATTRRIAMPHCSAT
jgi:hypothetical protein